MEVAVMMAVLTFATAIFVGGFRLGKLEAKVQDTHDDLGKLDEKVDKILLHFGLNDDG